MRIAVTGASGQLGRLVMEDLLEKVAAEDLIAVVRSPEKLADLAEKGVELRRGDYADPASLEAAFAGVDRLLLISSSEVGQRVVQHGNVIAAAKKAGVGLLVYTSILHADSSPMGLAPEHQETEKLIRQSGLDHVLLRNGWYMENFLGRAEAALDQGVLLGAAGDGKACPATRRDFAAAAAAVLAGEMQDKTVYELAGDEAFSLADLAAEVSRQSGKSVTYRDVPVADYAAALEGAGLPKPIAELLAGSDAGMAEGGLFDDSHDLSRLIGRPTISLAESVREALSR